MKYIIELLNKFPELIEAKEELINAVTSILFAVDSNRKIYTCGNGGSSSDADHIVAELMKGFYLKRELDYSEKQLLIDSGYIDNGLIGYLQKAVPAISLNGNMSLVTAISNDISSDYIFAQQIFGLGRKGDILICLSTSGNSVNILNAARVARAKGLVVIGFTGKGGGKLAQYCDIIINAPSEKTPVIQEYHLSMYHAICADVELLLFGN